MERDFERLQDLNPVKYEQGEAELKAEAAAAGVKASRVPTKVPTVRKGDLQKSSEVAQFKRTGP